MAIPTFDDEDVALAEAAEQRVNLNPKGRKQTKKYRPIVPITDTLLPFVQRRDVKRFVNWYDAPIDSIKKRFKTVMRAAGLSYDIKPYSLRHTMAVELRKRGAPAWEVQGRLGHRQPGVTETYAVFSPDYLSQGRVAIDAFFSEIGLLLRVPKELSVSVVIGKDSDHVGSPVLHQTMPHEAQLRFLAFPLLVEPCVKIGGRDIRVVSMLLAVEVRFRIAPATLDRRRAQTVLRPDAVHRCPRHNQRAVHREVIARQKRLDPGLGQHRRQKLRRNVAFQQRSRFFENVEWFHAASSTPMPTNQRNRRSYSSRSIRSRSERIE